MESFCREFQDLVPAVRVKRESADDVSPAIAVRENIRYEAVPAKSELPL
jgi:hypothetical protein